ncbi:MAG TPA: amidohydrolase [Ktedonobacter sp.]|nr:amidohydrolase [Ktedonobacter sp.]
MSESIAITNVRVFDGKALTDERVVVIDNGIISDATTADKTVDGQHGTLLPGLIDCHVHLATIANLEQATHWGITTMLDMGSQSMALTDSLRHHKGLADIRGAGNVACAPGGMPITSMGYPASSAVTGPADANRFVTERVAEGADYIKVIVEDPDVKGSVVLDVATIAALVEAAHQRGLKVIAHVTTVAAFKHAANAGVDVLTHAPFDADIDDMLAHSFAERGIVSVPTLITMRTLAGIPELNARRKAHGLDVNYSHARATVSAFHRAGVVIMAGTDAFQVATPSTNVRLQHGEVFGASLHEELRLLVEAGLTPVEALRSATVVPADYFGLTDRGVIEAGRRADLLLVEGDPTQNIAATRAIQNVWVAGVQVR